MGPEQGSTQPNAFLYYPLQVVGRSLLGWVRQANDGLLLAEVPAGVITLDPKISARQWRREAVSRSVSMQLKSSNVSEVTVDVAQAPTFSDQPSAGALLIDYRRTKRRAPAPGPT